MPSQETSSIAVCATEAADLDALVRVVRGAGSWSILPIQWPNREALLTAHGMAKAFLLHSGETPSGVPSELLMQLLGDRPEGAPLIVVGNEPARRAAPTCWLPSLPSIEVLGALLTNLIMTGEGGAFMPSVPPISLSWRRKTDMILGSSPAITQVLHALDHLAPAQTPVIITGESGVGKELVARALHFTGPRAKEPFIAINCAAIPENLFEAELFGYQRGAFTGAVAAHAGAFEAANKGTLFLDEIGEMPLAMQAKLLRVLETSEVQRIGSTEPKKVNFRLVSATNRTLEKEVKEGRFREDLFYRVRVYPLHVPPLRERPEDIPPIVTHHLSSIATRENRPTLRMTAAALEKIVGYSFPGNVRELVNLLERASLMSENNVIDARHIVTPEAGGNPGPASSLVPYKDAKQRFESEYYAQLMRTAGGNVSLAAKLGQKTRKEVYDALKRLGLEAVEYRSESGPPSDDRVSSVPSRRSRP
jgi:transcriptional regulator with AAA-type ATPase domain